MNPKFYRIFRYLQELNLNYKKLADDSGDDFIKNSTIANFRIYDMNHEKAKLVMEISNTICDILEGK